MPPLVIDSYREDRTPALLFHPGRDATKCLLFGGYGANGTIYQDTWTFDGTIWTELQPQTKPPARVWAGMAARENGVSRVTLFGGCKAVTNNDCAANDFLNDLWEYYSGNWHSISCPTCPSKREVGGQMAEESGGKVLLFGGYFKDAAGVSNYYSNTHRWDGTSWSNVSPATSPSKRMGGSMARVKSGVTWLVFLFGGGQSESNLANDKSWFWNSSANTWTQWTGSPAPSERQSMGMASTPGSPITSVTLFGGISEKSSQGSFTVYRDTWRWNG